MDAAEDDVTCIEALEALYERPQSYALAKEAPTVIDAYRRLVEASPFVALASVGPGGVDCSPRGDRAGFVRVWTRRRSSSPTGEATTGSRARPAV
ncbi:MAG: hypothetical protein AAF957_15620 [Planctomycetota bacterium]